MSVEDRLLSCVLNKDLVYRKGSSYLPPLLPDGDDDDGDEDHHQPLLSLSFKTFVPVIYSQVILGSFSSSIKRKLSRIFASFNLLFIFVYIFFPLFLHYHR